ncbi:MAG TPA: hypothetical protein PKA37_02135 [Planctomycetota bacterium]|jgi:hypothetical protein|nr:hypothetical protein [Planctomycetota bacterium]
MPSQPRYDRTQWSPFLAAFIGLLLLTILVLGALKHWEPIFILPAGALTLILQAFVKLRVTVLDREVRLQFGFLGPKKTIDLTHVSHMTPVRNRWYYGFGIRYVPGGWMWNVSGLDAVELEYLDGRRFRIGTPEPGLLADILKRARLDL